MSTVAPELLWDYVLGALSEEERAGIDAELARSPSLRAELAEITELACALPMSLEPIAPSPSLKARLLQSVSDPKPFNVWLDKVARLFDVGLERARALLELTYDPKAWSSSGMAGCDLIHLKGGPATAGADAGFVRVQPGFRFPHHEHLGDEITVVMQGAYRDSFNGMVIRAGDEITLHKGSDHHYVVEPGEDCIYATVVFGLRVTETEGPGAGWTVEGSKKDE